MSEVNVRKFGIRDLYKMYLSRGLKLPIMYILENLLFDITRGVSTHQYLQADELQVDGANAKHSVLYMSSWTSVIRNSTKKAVELLLRSHDEPVSLVDVGSGKGKVLLVWEEMYKLQPEFSILGIEFSGILSSVCKKNLHSFDAKKSCLFEGDVLNFCFKNLNKNIVFYMYNPFDSVLMNKFMIKVKSEMPATSKIVLIYNNSVHGNLMEKVGAKEIISQNSWHPNGQFKIYSLQKDSSI